jgi:hypothetical protein
MKIERADLAKIFPGHWDGGNGEFHGLVRAKGSQLQVECIFREELWRVSVFRDGVTLASSDDIDVRRAIATGLRESLRGLSA